MSFSLKIIQHNLCSTSIPSEFFQLQEVTISFLKFLKFTYSKIHTFWYLVLWVLTNIEPCSADPPIFHLFSQVFLISFVSVLLFSEYSSSIYFVRYICKNLLCITSDTSFLILIPNYSILLHRNIIKQLILYWPCVLLLR